MTFLLGDTAAESNKFCAFKATCNSRTNAAKPSLSDAGPLLHSTLAE